MNIEPQYHPDPPEEDINIDGFTQFNWKNATGRDEWKDPLDEGKKAKDEAEWLSVLSGETDRKAAIIHVDNFNREKWMKRIGEHDLHYRDIRYTSPYQGFAHKFHPADPDDPERITYAVIAENADVADKMEEAELEMEGIERHKQVGELLGFPDCCLDFFGEEWVNEGNVDPMYEITCNSGNAEERDGPEDLLVKDPNPGSNILWRYYGLSFITHIPCSWDCEHSIDVARNRYRIMVENGYEDGAQALYHWLNEPHVWEGYHRICGVRNRFVTSASRTDNYWSKKRIVWGQEHEAE